MLLLPAGLLAWELTHQRRQSAISRPKLLEAEADFNRLSLVARRAAARRARGWFCAGLALGIVALARPQWGRIEEQVFDQSREILIAVDLSRSMQAQDVKPSRLDRAKLLIQSLLERLDGERVGLVVFSGTAFLQSPLSSDYEILREFLPALGPDYLPEGGTNYRALIDTSLQAFGSSSAADRFLVILSDGEATDEDWKSRVSELEKKGIRVIGLGVGTSAGAMIPDGSGAFVKDDRGAVVLSRLENSTLLQLTQATKGVYRDASGWIDLAGLVKETVESGRKGEFVEKSQPRLVERFQWALAPALFCLLASFWREFPVRPKPRELSLDQGDPGPPLLPRMPPAVKTATTATAVLLGLISAALAFPTRAESAAVPKSQPGPDPLVAPLSKVVTRLSTKRERSAADWAELARTTVTYGEHLQNSQQPVPESPVMDALDAVDSGSALDPKAADWPKLRKDLEKFIKQDENQKPPQDQQKQQDKEQSDQDKKDQQDKQQDQQKQQQKDKQKQDQSKSGNDPNKEKQDDKPDADKNEEKPKDASEKESAFGDMKDQPTPPPPPPPSGTQKVGGAPEKKMGEPKDEDPALAMQLHKLDQLKNQDSPAKLYQLMEGERKPDNQKKGKDW